MFVAFLTYLLFRIILACALIIFIADKIFNKLVCCRLCRSFGHNDSIDEQDEEMVALHMNDDHSLQV